MDIDHLKCIVKSSCCKRMTILIDNDQDQKRAFQKQKKCLMGHIYTIKGSFQI